MSLVFLTGASGFIGGWVGQALRRQGTDVRALVRTPDQARELTRAGFQPVLGHMLDQEALRRGVQDADAVVHCAAWTGGSTQVSQGVAVNVEGTRLLVEAARAAGVERFLFTSSVAVYGVHPAPQIHEDAALPHVGEAYADSKIAGEKIVRASGLAWTILRPASTFGPGGEAWTLIPIRQIKARRLFLFGQDAGLVNPGYMENVVDAIVAALQLPTAVGEIFNVCDGYTVTYRTWYLRYARMLGQDSLPTLPAVFLSLAGMPAANWVRRGMGRRPVGPWSVHFRRNPSRFDVAKAQRLLNYRPRFGFIEAMDRTEAWLRQEGHLSV